MSDEQTTIGTVPIHQLFVGNIVGSAIVDRPFVEPLRVLAFFPGDTRWPAAPRTKLYFLASERQKLTGDSFWSVDNQGSERLYEYVPLNRLVAGLSTFGVDRWPELLSTHTAELLERIREFSHVRFRNKNPYDSRLENLSTAQTQRSKQRRVMRGLPPTPALSFPAEREYTPEQLEAIAYGSRKLTPEERARNLMEDLSRVGKEQPVIDRAAPPPILTGQVFGGLAVVEDDPEEELARLDPAYQLWIVRRDGEEHSDWRARMKRKARDVVAELRNETKGE